jgi:ribosome maturation factor RimP
LKRKDVESAVERLAHPLASARGLQLVDVEFVKEGPSLHLRVYVDKPGGVGLDDCQGLHEELGRLVDEAVQTGDPYYLEVSSPGLDRPLKKERDYEVFRGREVNVKTFGPVDGGRDFLGTLVGLENGEVVLDIKGHLVRIPREKVASARLALKL